MLALPPGGDCFGAHRFEVSANILAVFEGFHRILGRRIAAAQVPWRWRRLGVSLRSRRRLRRGFGFRFGLGRLGKVLLNQRQRPNLLHRRLGGDFGGFIQMRTEIITDLGSQL